MQSLLDDGNKDAGGDRDSDLGFDRVLGSSKKDFDPQMLYDPFEQLNDLLPINTDLLKLRSTTDSIPCVI